MRVLRIIISVTRRDRVRNGDIWEELNKSILNFWERDLLPCYGDGLRNEENRAPMHLLSWHPRVRRLLEKPQRRYTMKGSETVTQQVT